MSLIVAIATVALWARSYVVRDVVQNIDYNRRVIAQSVNGGIILVIDLSPSRLYGRSWFWDVGETSCDTWPIARTLITFSWATARTPSTRFVVFPHWVLVIVFGVPPILRLWLRRRRAPIGFPVDPPAISSPPP